MRRVFPILLLIGSALSVAPSAAAPAAATPLCGGSRSADFNGDGFSDLAVGVPREDVHGNADAGAVNVIYGSQGGLTANGNLLLTASSAGESVQPGDQFGSALSAGDFNRDGAGDLAISMPFRDIAAVADAGEVVVLYGSQGQGLAAAEVQVFTQESDGIADTAEPSDKFGWSLTVGDFDRSGACDLAVGVPYEDMGTVTDAGAVHVLYGASGGLMTSGSNFLRQDSPGVVGVSEEDDNFGMALAAGNFGRGFATDLAVGAAQETVDGQQFAGAVNVLYGSGAGITTDHDQMWTRGFHAVSGGAFGAELTAADFGRSGHADLAIGAPFASTSTCCAGDVRVLYGTRWGLSARHAQTWSPVVPGVPGDSHEGDGFGVALTAGNFGRSRRADLAIGSFNELRGGAVTVLYGGHSGLTTAGAQLWHHGTRGLEHPKAVGGFGSDLLAANFGRSFRSDLAIGALDDTVGGAPGPVRSTSSMGRRPV